MNQILYSGKAKKKPIALIIGIILVVIILVLTMGFALLNLANNKILNGVVVANIDVSNMTKEEAVEAVNKLYSEDTERTLVLNYEDFSVTLKTSDIGFGYTDANELVDEAYAYGRSGNIFSNNFTILKSYMNTEKRIETEEKIDVSELEEAVESVISGDSVFASDDYYEVSGDKLLITKGVEGKKIDFETLEQRVLEALKNRDMLVDIPVIISTPAALDIDEIYAMVHTKPENATYKEGASFEIIKEKNGLDFDVEDVKEKYRTLEKGNTLEIQLEVVEPEIKLEDLGDVLFKNLLATHTSTYDTSDKDRVTNLEVAAERCNNTILYPGDEFSYNEALGHRTIANGFKMGNSFAGGKVVKTVGGGICQVSSTLYNAVLKAGLTITDRTAHGMYVKYVEPSTDATVVDNAIDFKFRNDRNYPVKIVATCKDGVVTTSVFGFKDADEATIEIEVKILETLEYKTVRQNDNSMKKGTTKVVQEPVNGYVSESYKVYYKNGVEVSRELISKDRYSPTDEIIKVGTKTETVVKPVIPEPEIPEVVEPVEPEPILPPGWDNPESGY